MPRDVVLIGRDRELHDLGELLTGATTNGAARVLEGDAGIGKSALVAVMAHRARSAGFAVLSCTGVREQTRTGLSGLRELLTPALDKIGALPLRQRAALRAALGLSDDPAADGLLLNIAILGLLEEMAGDEPLLLLAEDTQWLDQPTTDIIGFLSRRLTNVPILILATRRTDLVDPLTAYGIPAITVPPLDHASSIALLDSLALGLSTSSKARILQAAGGNPLALRELSTALHDYGLADGTRLPDQLPMTDRLEQTFSVRAASLPQATRTAMLVIAAAEDLDLGDLMAAAQRFGAGLDDLAAAEAADLITVTGGRARFRHPLVASAVYGAADQADKVAIHRALADVTSNPDQAAWHRAKATQDPDEEVAAELAAVGERAQQRGAPADAAAAFRRAADLSPLPDARAARLTQAAEAARTAGMRAEAEAAVEEAFTLMPEPALVAKLALIQSRLGTTGVHSPEIIDLVGFARRIAGPDGTAYPAERMELLVTAAMSAFNRFAPAEALEQIDLDLSTLDMGYPHPIRTMALSVLDPLGRAAEIRPQLPALAEAMSSYPEALLGIGQAAEAMHDLDTAALCWARSAEAFRGSGSLRDLCTALVQKGRLSAVRGDLTEALGDLDLCVRMASDLEMTMTMANGMANMARVHIWRGADEAAAAALDRQSELEKDGARRQSQADFAWTRGLLALTQRRYRQSWESLRGVSVFPPTQLWAIGDLTEAAVGAGRADEVRGLLQDAEHQAEVFGAPFLQMLTQRSRALLAAPEDAPAHFHLALEAGTASGMPLEQARTQLLYGEWLRRERRVTEARAPLADALLVFDRAGARPFSARAAAELRAAGAAPYRAAPNASVELVGTLSAQELQIARLAAQGLSNREIADQVYLSHRTVGSQLYRIFPKLGITSRSQLRDILAKAG